MSRQINQFPTFPLAELHAHLSSSIRPSVYWQIAHDSGFKLPMKDYFEFFDYIRISSHKKMTLKEYLDTIMHPWLDKLSSGTHPLERAVYEILSGAYRRTNIQLLELRNNPMKHNMGGIQDLDHVIMACLRGMERALLEYPKMSAGIIFCMDRQFTMEKNAIIIEKAIKYKNRGVIGIDVANYDTGMFKFKEYTPLFEKARSAGLHVTLHSGETDDTNDMWDAITYAKPERIGHGIKAAYDKKLMKELVKQNIVLEVCPMSNIVTKAVKDLEEMKFILKTFVENEVQFTINTDWPETIENGHLWRQFAMLRDEKILTEEQLEECNDIAFKSSFIPAQGLEAYL